MAILDIFIQIGMDIFIQIGTFTDYNFMKTTYEILLL